jgi:hypothetical protein
VPTFLVISSNPHPYRLRLSNEGVPKNVSSTTAVHVAIVLEVEKEREVLVGEGYVVGHTTLQRISYEEYSFRLGIIMDQ